MILLNYIRWNPNPEIIQIFGLSLRYYGVFVVGGLALSFYLLSRIFKQERLPAQNIDTLILFTVPGIFAGVRLGHCLFYEPAYYLTRPLEIVLPFRFTPEGAEFIGFQGLASHGAGIGFLTALIIYSVVTRHRFLSVLELIAIVGPLAAGFVRLANLMNSEIIGRPTDMPWAFVFERVDSVPRHPAQLYEAIVYFLVFGLLYVFYKTGYKKPGNGFFIGLAWSVGFIARFIIEFFKENQVAFEERMTINMGQWLSVPFIVGGIAFWVYSFIKKRNDLNSNKRPIA